MVSARVQFNSCRRSYAKYRSRIHGHTIFLRFLDIILRVLRLEFSLYNFYNINQFQTTFAQGEWGGGGVRAAVEMIVNSKEENSEDFCPNYILESGLCTSCINR